MLRKMNETDRQTFYRFAKDFYASPALLHDVPQEYHRRNFDAAIGDSPFLEGYMICVDDASVGFALIARSYSTEAGGTCIWLEDIYLTPDFRGKGLAREVFALLDDIARKEDAARIRLEVEPDNANAYRLYQKLGYRELGYTSMIKERTTERN